MGWDVMTRKGGGGGKDGWWFAGGGGMEGGGGDVRSMRSSRAGRFSRPFLRLSLARWRSSSKAAAWRELYI